MGLEPKQQNILYERYWFPMESIIVLLQFTEIHAPKNLCKDITNLNRWGNGDVEFKISELSDIPYAIKLIQQVIDMQVEG